MAKSRNQKGKILVIEHLLQETGEGRIVTMQEILDRLTEYGITAERKSIYDDIEALREFGLDVQFKRGRPGGYYLVGNVPKQAMPVRKTEERPADKDKAEKAAEHPKIPKYVLAETEIQEGEKSMKLQCKKSREKEIREYFGSHGEYKIKESGFLQVTVPQISGPEFYGWLAMMGKDVHILKPKKVAASYRDYLKALAKEYKGV
ncbi:WYL domain-containing protein [Blautia sp. MSJ-19]|uniref:WYL domain-containing protein n=1 Tax=Blautia sp. MSJ-19 TaxID=2841517 RepID=UPI001C0ED768|nr:WYL domain-containing protein [Blautia sp. MSJ-19]MBU5481241.1 WYL domain-containing protein [Blautia sp. MSJ-19]